MIIGIRRLKRANKKKRKINWREYNESLVRRREVMFGADFFIELASRIKGNEQVKGRSKISLSEFLDIAARHSTRISTSIQTAGNISKNTIKIHGTATSGTRFHNNVVESSKSKVEVESRKKGEKVTIVVDATGINVSNRGDWTRENG